MAGQKRRARASDLEKTAGMPIAKLARVLRVSLKSAYRYVHKERIPPRDLMAKWTKATGLSSDYFYRGDDQ